MNDEYHYVNWGGTDGSTRPTRVVAYDGKPYGLSQAKAWWALRDTGTHVLELDRRVQGSMGLQLDLLMGNDQ